MSAWDLWTHTRSRASRTPNHPAFVEVASGRALSYGRLVERVEGSAPLSKRVILQSGNDLDFPVVFLAALLQGRALLPIGKDVPCAEFRRTLDRTEVTGTTGAGSLLLCSSGTTGLPKIVRRSRASLDAVAGAMVDAIGLRDCDRVIAAVPLVHSYGMEHGLLAPLRAGATVLLCDGLNMAHISRALDAGATVFPAVPSMVEMLAASGPTRHPLRLVYCAGAPLPPTVAGRFFRTFGLKVGQVYGLTEVGSVTYLDPERDASDTVGRPFAEVSVRLLDQDEDGEGEIAIRAPSMLDEYVGEPLHLVDGHFPTGDLGRITPAGELKLTGRRRLLIDVGGAKVNPLEVEQLLLKHPAVAEAVVVPLHLSETVRKVRAIIVPVDTNNPPDASDVRAFLRAHLAAYKVPRVIDMRASLPRSATGKVLRHELETT